MKNRTSNIKKAVNLLNSCFSGINKLYWLNALVKQGQLSEAEAGFIIHYHLI